MCTAYARAVSPMMNGEMLACVGWNGELENEVPNEVEAFLKPEDLKVKAGTI